MDGSAGAHRIPGLNNREIWAGPARRLLLLKWALCAALLSEIALCPKLWIADRAFPTIPIVSVLPDLPQTASLALLLVLVGSLLFVAASPCPIWPLVTLLIAGILLVIFDISRLQPWFFEYLLMFLALTTVRWREPASVQTRAAWAGCAFVVAAIYVWSGLQKANGAFATEVFPWLLHPMGAGAVAALKPFWFVAPVCEFSVGVLLFVPRLRPIGMAGAATMHVVNLLIIGPLGWNINSTVWPWNFWVAVMAFLLFFRSPDPVFRWAWPLARCKFILLALGVMPALNWFGLWDGFLSGSYYSGRLQDGWIYLTPGGLQALPPAYAESNPALGPEPPDQYRLSILEWGMAKMNAPPYLEVRVYQAIVKKLIADGVPPTEITLYVRDQTSPLNPRRRYVRVAVR